MVPKNGSGSTSCRKCRGSMPHHPPGPPPRMIPLMHGPQFSPAKNKTLPFLLHVLHLILASKLLPSSSVWVLSCWSRHSFWCSTAASMFEKKLSTSCATFCSWDFNPLTSSFNTHSPRSISATLLEACSLAAVTHSSTSALASSMCLHL